MMRDIIIAIDPGANGGIAFSPYDGETRVYKMPDTETDIVDLLNDLIEPYREDGFTITVYIEKVGGFTGQGQPGSRMFTFGRGVGVLIGALIAYRCKIIEVPPTKWQKPYGTSKGMTKTQWKNKLKDHAQKLYPQLKVTLSTADALLILNYAVNL